MDENKQIEEMALAICRSRGASNGEGCERCCTDTVCLYQEIANALHKAGYRKQEWISVEERLPEVGEDVLLYSKEDDKIDIGHYSIMFRRFFLRKFEDGNVTHWMPLPQPPKMKGE